MHKKNSLRSIEPKNMHKKHIFKIICAFFAFFLVSHSFYAVEQEGERNALITIKKANITMEEVIREIERQSGFLFIRDDDVNLNQRVSINVKNEPVEKTLERLFKGKGIEYRLKEKHILLSLQKQEEAISGKTRIEQQQKKRITGTVRDANGETVIGANVVEDGVPANGTVTDANGYFSLEITPGAPLRISYIGYNEQKVETKDKSSLDIILLEDVKALDELVVVGYGIQKKVNLSGAVESIGIKELTNRSTNNIGLALQGLIPNLNITVSNGSPDSTPDFNIRGMTSINGGEPLILVDGVRTSTADFSRMNVIDIQNISVLKDASSAAIYGAQAAFGVILVTTKRGEGGIKLQFDNTYNVRQRAYLPDIIKDPYIQATYKNIMGAPWYHLYDDASVEYAKKLRDDPSLPHTIVHPNDPNAYLYLASTDWHDETYKKYGTSRSHNLGLSGSSQKVSYYLGGEYYNERGMFRYNNDDYNKFNIRSRIEFKPAEWLLIGNNTALTIYSYDRPYYSGYEGNEYKTNTLEPIRNPDGSYTALGARIIGSLLDGGKRKETRSVVYTQFNTQMDLVKDVWSIKSDFTAKITNGKKANHNYGKIPYKDIPGKDAPIKYFGGPGDVERGNEKTNYLLFNSYSDFQKTWGLHYFSFLSGFTQEYEKWSYNFSKRSNLISNLYPTPQLATGEMVISEDEYDWAIRGAFYRFNYILNERYILETNGRYDGTSRFPKERRFGFFPSFSAAWIISKEKFFEPMHDWFSFAKVRVSYGALGNQNVSPYAYVANMNAGVVNCLINGSKEVGVYSPGLISKHLTWEKIYTKNAGVDLNFFNNRLTSSFDLYQRETKDMLAKGKTLPAVLGTSEPSTNAADLKTNGWDLTIGWQDRFNLFRKPFNYSARFILSDSRAWITRFENPTKYREDYYEGMEMGEIWGLTTLGFFKDENDIKNHADQWDVTSWAGSRPIEPGDLKYMDLNEDKKINYGKRTVDDPGDFKIIGNSSKRYNFGLDLNADWNNFDMRLFLQGVGKRDFYYGGINFVGIYWAPWANVLKHNLDHWTPEKPDAYFPRLKSYLTQKDLGIPQTRYLQNGAFMRLKNLTLGYSLPKRLINSFGIGNLRFYFSGENIFELSGLKRFNMDPEVYEYSAYPIQRTYSIGLNIAL